MPLERTLGRVGNDLARGDVSTARQRLRSLVDAYPGQLVLALAERWMGDFLAAQFAATGSGDPRRDLLALGTAYVGYATAHPARFLPVFDPTINCPGNPPTPAFGALVREHTALLGDASTPLRNITTIPAEATAPAERSVPTKPPPPRRSGISCARTVGVGRGSRPSSRPGRVFLLPVLPGSGGGPGHVELPAGAAAPGRLPAPGPSR